MEPLNEKLFLDKYNKGSEKNRLYRRLGHFHKPGELKAEIEDAGFLDVDIRGVIGPCWLIRNLDRAWKNEKKRENIMRVVRLLEKEDSLMGLSTHFLSISRKQKDDGQKISD